VAIASSSADYYVCRRAVQNASKHRLIEALEAQTIVKLS
jgi:hypothetical protein